MVAPARVAPIMPPSIQMPDAVPLLAGSTHCWITMGPHAITQTRDTPSRARVAKSASALWENAPATEDRQAKPAATRMIRFGGNVRASTPTGSEKTMPTKVKIDISHEAA